MSEKLPPLIQEIKADATQAIAEQSKFEDSTRHMSEFTTDAHGRMRDSHGRFVSSVETGNERVRSSGESARAGFLSMVGGLGLANLAADGVEKTLEGLHHVIETGVERAKDDAQINAQLAAGIQSTGGAAGTTVAGMNELAESIARMSGQSADSIGKTESLLLTFTNIKNVGPDKIFDETTLAAANMAARFGGDATQSAIQLGKALNDPIKGMAALRRVGVSFTADQIAQVKALQASGDMMGAQKIILQELTTEFGGSAKAAGETFPGAIARAKESFEEMSGRIVTAFMPVMTEVFTHLVDLFQGMAPHIEKFAEMLASGLEKVGPILAPIGAAIGEAFKAAEPALASVGGIFKQLEPTIASLVPVFANVISTVSPFSIVLKALTPVLPQLASTVVSLAQSLGGSLTTVLQVLAPVVASVAQTLAGALSGAIVALLPAVGQLAATVGQVLVTAVKVLAPILTSLAPVFAEVVSAVGQLAGVVAGALSSALQAILPAISQVVQILASTLGSTLTALAPVIGELAQVIGQVLASAMTAIAPLLKLAAQFIGELLQAVAPLIPPILQLVAAFVPLLEPIAKLVGALLTPLIGLLTTLLQPILSLVSAIIGALVPAISAVVTWFSSNLSPVIQAAQTVIQGISDFIGGVFSGNWSRAWSGIQSIFSGVWQGIQSIAEGALNGIIDLVNGAIGTIDDALSGISNATGGLINLNIPKIPHFDDGGEVPGGPGSPVLSVNHGGEFVLSKAMREGRQPIPQSVRDQIGGSAPSAPVAAGGNTYVFNANVTQSDPSASEIAAALGFEFRTNGG